MPDSWRVEALQPGDPYTYALTFAGTSHDHQDLTARAALFVKALPGVVGTSQPDRNRIYVKTIGVDRQVLEGSLGHWWDIEARKAPAAPWASAMDQLAAAAYQELKAEGYRKSKWTFNRRVSSDLIHVIELAHHFDATDMVDQVRVSGGLALPVVTALTEGRQPDPEKAIHEAECQVRFLFHHQSDIDAGPQPITDFFTETALPYLHRFSEMADLVKDDANGQPPPPTGPFGAPMQALVYAAMGRHDHARRLFQLAFNASQPMERTGLVALAAKARSGPLHTGARDVLTVEEEAVLRQWVDAQPQMVSHVKGIYAAMEPKTSKSVFGRFRGHKNDFLDGSLESLKKFTPSALAGLEEGVMAEILRPQLPLAFFGTTVRQEVESEKRWLPDYRRALAERLACYIAVALTAEEPSVQWAIAGDGEMILTGVGETSVFQPLLDALDSATDGAAESHLHEVAQGYLESLRRPEVNEFQPVTLEG